MAKVSIIVPSSTDNGLPAAYNRLFTYVNNSKKHMPTASQMRLMQAKMEHDANLFGPDPKAEMEFTIVKDALQLFTDGILKCEGWAGKISMAPNSRKGKKDKMVLAEKEDEALQRAAIQELIASKSCIRVQKKMQVIATMSNEEKDAWINADKCMQRYRLVEPAKTSFQ